MQKIDPNLEKIKWWVQHPQVVRLPRISNLPKLESKKFDSHEAFNAWKLSVQLELIRQGGAVWTR
jgi:hypothetical protein